MEQQLQQLAQSSQVQAGPLQQSPEQHAFEQQCWVHPTGVAVTSAGRAVVAANEPAANTTVANILIMRTPKDRTRHGESWHQNKTDVMERVSGKESTAQADMQRKERIASSNASEVAGCEYEPRV